MSDYETWLEDTYDPDYAGPEDGATVRQQVDPEPYDDSEPYPWDRMPAEDTDEEEAERAYGL